MSESVSKSKLAGIAAAVLVVVGAGIWLGSRVPQGEAPLRTSGLTNQSAVLTAPATATHDPFFRKFSDVDRSNTAPAAPLPPPAVAGNVSANWEDKVDQVLTSTNEDSDKAKQMLGLFPNLPSDGQIEVAQHLANLTPDSDYASLAALLTNSALPEDVLDVLLQDVLNRPNSLKLPALLDVARDPQNPKAPEAKDLLQLFLDDDYGNDWSTWQSKMEAWLKENPD